MCKETNDAFWERQYQSKGTYHSVDSETAEHYKSLGFFAITSLCLDLARWPMSLYLTDRGLCRVHPVNGYFSAIINDKRFVPLLFRASPHLVPDLAIGVENGELKFVMEEGEMRESTDLVETLKHYVAKFGKLFLKPAGLSGGAGTLLIDVDNVHEALKALVSPHSFLINECLDNEDYSDSIHKNSVNSLRVHFYRGASGIKCHSIVHKFGTSYSQQVDNLRAGGLACQVDAESGLLSKGWSPNHAPRWMSEHPDSKQKLVGCEIPQWREKQAAIKEMMDILHFVDFVGVDIAVTRKGLRLLEVNSLPSRVSMQFYKPALLDAEFRQMLARRNYRP
jgi:hypothetical protein